jgi:hypothetical protein
MVGAVRAEFSVAVVVVSGRVVAALHMSPSDIVYKQRIGVYLMGS